MPFSACHELTQQDRFADRNCENIGLLIHLHLVCCMQPPVATDVKRRYHLANCILIRGGEAITTLIEDKVYAIRSTIAPASMLKLDVENEREVRMPEWLLSGCLRFYRKRE